VEGLKWGVLIVAALAAGYMLYAYARLMLWGARNILSGGPAYFNSAAWYIALPWLQLAVILGLAIASGFYRRSAWSVLRNATIAAWLFVILDMYVTFAVP
jgi:hypothetical protein